jgi:hypothetical protein
MPQFPRIDGFCPLSQAQQREIDGLCRHCDTHVHRLDGLSEAEKRKVLAEAQGPICVSYRVPAPAPAAARRSGMAIAATLIVASAASTGLPLPASAAPLLQDAAAEEKDVITVVGGTIGDHAAAEWIDPAETKPAIPMRVNDLVSTGSLDADEDEDMEELREVVFIGAVTAPGQSEWVDTGDTLPSLPMRAADDDTD